MIKRFIVFIVLSSSFSQYSYANSNTCHGSAVELFKDKKSFVSDSIRNSHLKLKKSLGTKKPLETLGAESIYYNKLHLIEVAENLKLKGYRSRILSNDPRASMGQDILEVLAPEDIHRASLRDLSIIDRNLHNLQNRENAPFVIYNPIDLALRQVKGSWSSHRHTLSVPLESLFDDAYIPTTLIHERLHYEKALAISENRTGPLRGFYGNLSGNLLGESGYAKKGYISLDEVKAWRINVRTQELGVKNRLRQGSVSMDILKIQKDGLKRIYEQHLKISEDVFQNLEPIAQKILGAQKLQDIKPWSFKIEGFEWMKGVETPTAMIKIKRGWFDGGYEFKVPLVKLKKLDDKDTILRLLQEQISINLVSIKSHRDQAQRRMNEFNELPDEAEALSLFLSR
jgi:hypothetical protein